jgi:2-oxoisovalerate dehydrogenase E2 component (dihydrolipoyl transacylase)
MVITFLLRFVKEGDAVEQFTPICEVQSDKAAVEISSRYDGTVSKLYYAVGDVAKVGSPLVDIETADDEPETAAPIAPKAKKAAPVPAKAAVVELVTGSSLDAINADNTTVFATPAVRRIAREHSVDIKLVKGTGPNGRILKSDVQSFIDTPVSATTVTTPPPAVEPSQDTVVPLTMIQKAMFKSMTKSLAIPHFGYSDEINLNAASAFRKDINSMHSFDNLPFKKISLMPIFLKCMSTALLEFPILNACVQADSGAPTLLYRSSHNIGIAMDTPQGYM